MTETTSTPKAVDGTLVGRADLGTDVILDALRDRMDQRGLPRADAEKVYAAAFGGNLEALDLVRTINLPVPVARLSMPVQRLTHGGRRRRLRASISGFMTPLRG